MAPTPLEVVQSAYDAFRRKDAAAIFALFAPDAVIRQTELVPWGGTFRGTQPIGHFFAKLLENIDSRVEFDRFVEAGESVVAVGRSRGTVRSNGREFDVDAIHVWTVRGGRVVRFEVYIDTPSMLRALEGS